MSVEDTQDSFQLHKPDSKNEPSLFHKIISFLFRLLQEVGTATKRLFVAERLEIRTGKEGYKPKIVLTGEKLNLLALKELQRRVTNQVKFVSLEDLKELKSKSKEEFDPEKDILLLGVHKAPGDNPIRWFASVDGPLHKHKDVILQFKNEGVLLFKHPYETRTNEQIKTQLSIQVVEMKSELVDTRCRNVALAVQKLFTSE